MHNAPHQKLHMKGKPQNCKCTGNEYECVRTAKADLLNLLHLHNFSVFPAHHLPHLLITLPTSCPRCPRLPAPFLPKPTPAHCPPPSLPLPIPAHTAFLFMPTSAHPLPSAHPCICSRQYLWARFMSSAAQTGICEDRVFFINGGGSRAHRQGPWALGPLLFVMAAVRGVSVDLVWM